MFTSFAFLAGGCFLPEAPFVFFLPPSSSSEPLQLALGLASSLASSPLTSSSSSSSFFFRGVFFFSEVSCAVVFDSSPSSRFRFFDSTNCKTLFFPVSKKYWVSSFHLIWTTDLLLLFFLVLISLLIRSVFRQWKKNTHTQREGVCVSENFASSFFLCKRTVNEMYNGFVDDLLELSLIVNDHVLFPFKLLLLFNTITKSERERERERKTVTIIHWSWWDIEEKVENVQVSSELLLLSPNYKKNTSELLEKSKIVFNGNMFIMFDKELKIVKIILDERRASERRQKQRSPTSKSREKYWVGKKKKWCNLKIKLNAASFRWICKNEASSSSGLIKFEEQWKFSLRSKNNIQNQMKIANMNVLQRCLIENLVPRIRIFFQNGLCRRNDFVNRNITNCAGHERKEKSNKWKSTKNKESDLSHFCKLSQILSLSKDKSPLFCTCLCTKLQEARECQNIQTKPRQWIVVSREEEILFYTNFSWRGSRIWEFTFECVCWKSESRFLWVYNNKKN